MIPTEGSRPRIANAMTVDVEEYFHASVFNGVVSRVQWDTLESRVCRSTEVLLDMFSQAGLKASFFVLGWVASRYPDLVRRIVAEGHELASHGYWHGLIYEQTPEEFREDVRRAKGVLESIGGCAVEGFRAPSYSITSRSLWALDVLIDEGYRYDASIFPIHHDRYGIPGAPRHPHAMTRPNGSLIEAPPSTAQIGSLNVPVAGGGYFRLLPYAWTRWGIRRLNTREQKPAIFYIHPWELDAGQPRLGLGPVNSARHYRNLHQTETRLRRLLDEFRFVPLKTVLTNGVH